MRRATTAATAYQRYTGHAPTSRAASVQAPVKAFFANALVRALVVSQGSGANKY